MPENNRRNPKVVPIGKGKYALPDPVPADYRQEIPDEAFEIIDEQCDQDELSSGKQIEKFEW